MSNELKELVEELISENRELINHLCKISDTLLLLHGVIFTKVDDIFERESKENKKLLEGMPSNTILLTEKGETNE